MTGATHHAAHELFRRGQYGEVGLHHAFSMQSSAGHTATHWGESKWPSHSVHLAGSIMKVPPFSRMATLGHSGSQAEQPVQVEAMILRAMRGLLGTGESGGRGGAGESALADARVAAGLVLKGA